MNTTDKEAFQTIITNENVLEFTKGYVKKPKGLYKLISPVANSIIDHILDNSYRGPVKCSAVYLAKIFKVGNKTVIKAIKELEDKNLITKKGGGKGKCAKLYQCNISIDNYGNVKLSRVDGHI
jgi:hypothetical protein